VWDIEIKKPFIRLRMKGFGVRKKNGSISVQDLREDGMLAYQWRRQQEQAWYTPFIFKDLLEFKDISLKFNPITMVEREEVPAGQR
jgi:hypothetical protein